MEKFFRKDGKGWSVFLTKWNTDAYLHVLQGHMMNFFHIHECLVFMQDSAPYHKEKQLKKFFEKHQIDLFE